jgi:7-cyano-7-deazaguanine synthase
MKATVVPNRNMIMISIASAVAVNNSYQAVFTGVHAGDHFVYPDCRPRFIRAANLTVVTGNEGFGVIPPQPEGTYPTDFVIAPYVMKTKADIAYRALELDVPLHMTWSCYKGDERHCGKCGTCVERLEAIDEAQARWIASRQQLPPVDHTDYDDVEFWRQALRVART